MELKWQETKPSAPCVFVTKYSGDYYIWRFVDISTSDGTYLGWCTETGAEWDDISDCNFDQYLVLEWL